MLDFPLNPAIDTVYAPLGAGRAWKWDGTAWELVTDELDPRMAALIADTGSQTYAALIALIDSRP